MALQNLYKNKNVAMFLDVMRRNRGITLLYTFILFLCGPFVCFMNMVGETNNFKNSIEYLGPHAFAGLTVGALVAALIAATFTNSHFHSRTALDAYYALPLKREGLFLSHNLAGIACVLLPLILNWLFELLVPLAFMSYIQYVPLLSIFDLFVKTCAMAIAVYAITAFVAVQVGTHFETFLFGLIINFAVPILAGISMILFSGALYGFSDKAQALVNMMIYASPGVLMGYILVDTSMAKIYSVSVFGHGLAALVWFAIAALLLLAATYLFRRRRAEISGRPQPRTIIAFIIKIIALYGAGILMIFICVSLLGGGRIKDWFLPSVIFYIIGAALAFAMVEGALSLGFKDMLKKWKQFALMALCGLIVVVCAYTGGLGYETRIPKADSVKSVTVPGWIFESQELSGLNGYVPEYDTKGMYYFRNDLELNGLESINAFINLHRAFVDNREPREPAIAPQYQEEYSISANFTYKLKSGFDMSRNYGSASIDKSVVKDLYLGASEEADEKSNTLYTVNPEHVSLIYVRDRLGIGALNMSYGPTAQKTAYGEFLAALQTDMKSETAEQRLAPDKGRACVLGMNLTSGHSAEISIMPWYTNTIKLLDKYCPDYKNIDASEYNSAYIFNIPENWGHFNSASELLSRIYEDDAAPWPENKVSAMYYDYYGQVNMLTYGTTAEYLDELAEKQPELVTKVTDADKIQAMASNGISRVYYYSFQPNIYAVFVEGGYEGYIDALPCYPIIAN
ncbi:MAG: hypothetical protein LBC56_02980 [Oscillospiraceae bacterium]|jgi:hypothetical protein|nr:hypothetical protein [Oscillospiraceae bacterium]